MERITPKDLPAQLKLLVGPVRKVEYPTRQGYTSQVAIIESKFGKFVVKCSSGRFLNHIERERQILEALSETNLPVPRLYGYCITEVENAQKAWLLMNFLPGVTIRTALSQEHDPFKRVEICRNFGQVLAQIHNTTVHLKFNPYQTNWLTAKLEQAETNLRNGFLPAFATPELLAHLQKNQPTDSDNRLIHGDFTVDNTLIVDGIVSGVIDWSGGNWGDPRYDIATAIRPKPAIFDRQADREAFFSSYGKISLPPEIHKYFLNLYLFF